MFNITTCVIFLVISIVETYKYVIQKAYNYVNFFKKNEVTYDLLILQLVTAWGFFTVQLSTSINITGLFWFTVFVYTIFTYFFNKFGYYNNTIFIVLFIVHLLSLKSITLVSVLAIAELLSIAMFFVLFFNNTKQNVNTQISSIFFIITNIIVFLFGVMSIFVILHIYGTLDLYVLNVYSTFTVNETACLTFVLYILFKFGQGPVIFFKFRFYRGVGVFSLSAYLFIYVVLIWPLLAATIPLLIVNYSLVVTTTFVLSIVCFVMYSIFVYNSFVDFLVFSTWVFSLYILLYTFNIR